MLDAEQSILFRHALQPMAGAEKMLRPCEIQGCGTAVQKVLEQ
jgi:hypothetical protein